MDKSVVYSDKKDDWGTPPWLIEIIREHWLDIITLDPASNETAQEYVQASRYMTEEDDGLTLPWLGNVFLNPPFSLKKEFLNKWDQEKRNIARGAIILPASTGSKGFKRLVDLSYVTVLPARRVNYMSWQMTEEPGHCKYAERKGVPFPTAIALCMGDRNPLYMRHLTAKVYDFLEAMQDAGYPCTVVSGGLL